MHRVLSVCDKSMRFDIYLQLKTTKLKQGMNSIDIFILAFFDKLKKKFPENYL